MKPPMDLAAILAEQLKANDAQRHLRDIQATLTGSTGSLENISKSIQQIADSQRHLFADMRLNESFLKVRDHWRDLGFDPKDLGEINARLLEFNRMFEPLSEIAKKHLLAMKPLFEGNDELSRIARGHQIDYGRLSWVPPSIPFNQFALSGFTLLQAEKEAMILPANLTAVADKLFASREVMFAGGVAMASVGNAATLEIEGEMDSAVISDGIVLDKALPTIRHGLAEKRRGAYHALATQSPDRDVQVCCSLRELLKHTIGSLVEKRGPVFVKLMEGKSLGEKAVALMSDSDFRANFAKLDADNVEAMMGYLNDGVHDPSSNRSDAELRAIFYRADAFLVSLIELGQ